MRLRFVALRYARLLIPVAMLAAASGARAEPLYNKRVYSPDAKSYFELVRVGKGHSLRGADIAAVNWANARKLAYGRAYKGVRGRLAVVKSRAVNDF
ncbi:MAG: hypothetical protein ACE5DS_07190, partial [Kiloniellaceae bacterium]